MEEKFTQFLSVQYKAMVDKAPTIKDFAEIEPDIKKAITEFKQSYK